MPGKKKDEQKTPSDSAERNFLSLRNAGFDWDGKKRIFHRDGVEISSQVVLGANHRDFIMMMREDMLIELTPFQR